ncbi:urotensin II-related peptide [Halichoeres trimaculatus]|uniref:urotensin II-related peptide n=1 Tax=Halichoeres trimaculatus TaxID=147232 RepID=UPI003D9F5C6A
MLNRAAPESLVKTLVIMLLIPVMGFDAAPTQKGFVKPPHPPPSLTHAPEKSPSQFLKHWLLSTKAAGADQITRLADRTTAGMTTTGGRLRLVSPDKRAQMLKMISALEELHRTFNSTLSSRITIMPRASSRHPGRKNKLLPGADERLKQTTAAPAAVNSTASKTSADVVVPSLTGRNFRKSLPPQSRKTNKRVCFWKYCSQN